MHAHGIEVFDRADHHEVVAEIAHHFELVFFPAEHGLFDQRFVHGARVEGVRDGFGEFLAVVGDRAARAAQRERRANHHGKPKLIAKAQRVLRIVDQRRGGNVQADLAAGVLEPQAVFGHFDGAQRGADQFDFVLFEDAAFGQFHGEVQRGLAADGGQQRVGLFLGDDFFEIFLGERLDVGAVGHFRVGHDRGRIGIHQHHFVALRAQRLARLRAGIVEFAGLADDDRAGADDQNFLDVGAFGHRNRGGTASAVPQNGPFF